jgi:membrane fusion protein (multidrug efflux system)
MRRDAGVLAAVVALAALGYGCSGVGEGKTEAGAGKPPVAVDVATVTPATLVQTVDVVGTLEPRFAADVRSEFTGVIEEVYVTQWVHVDKGTPLAKLDARDADAILRRAKAATLQVEVAEQHAERELERAVKLKEHGLLTQQGLDDARSARDAAVAATQAAEAELTAAETRAAKTVIRSPMAGTVALRAVSVGDRVDSVGGGAMFRIVDTRLLDLTAVIPSARSAAVHVGQKLEFTVDAYPGKTFSGRVTHINPTADPVSRTVKVMVEVPNPAGELRGGTFVKGWIRTGERTGVLQIPRAALLSWDVERGSGEVFVAEGEIASRRQVRTGEATGDSVEVIDGLAAGERVVTRGGFLLKPGDRIVVANSQAANPQGA